MNAILHTTALSLILCACTTKDPKVEPENHEDPKQADASEQGQEIMRMVTANLEALGKSLGVLDPAPVDLQEAISMVSGLRVSQNRTWPGEVQAGTRYGDFYFLSSAATVDGLNRYGSGYLVNALTGEAYQYHVW
ncbi:MAG: hypothetical protein GY930_00055 [bacterium]|nr:hypothetical protein [bacterium]